MPLNYFAAWILGFLPAVEMTHLNNAVAAVPATLAARQTAPGHASAALLIQAGRRGYPAFFAGAQSHRSIPATRLPDK